MTDEKREALVVIMTSGSTDYLSDTTGSRRFWPVTLLAGEGSPPDDGQLCDGLHDEGAPAIYLCTRCFPPLDHDDEDDSRETE